MGGRVGLFSTLVARLATCSGFMKDKGVRSAQTLSSDDLARIPARVAWWGPVSYQHLPIHDFPCAWFFGILGPVSYQHCPIYDFPCVCLILRRLWACLVFTANVFLSMIFEKEISLRLILRRIGACFIPTSFPCAWFCGILGLLPVSIFLSTIFLATGILALLCISIWALVCILSLTLVCIFVQHRPCIYSLPLNVFLFRMILYFLFGTGLYFCSA